MEVNDIFVCVDDEPNFRKLVEEVASRSEVNSTLQQVTLDGIKSLKAKIAEIDNGEVAAPKFFIVDMSMNKADDGIRALKEIRKSKKSKNCPAIIHSQFLDDQTVLDSFAQKANSVVDKPTTREDQEATIADILDYWTNRDEYPSS